MSHIKYLAVLLVIVFASSSMANANKPPEREYYEIRIYHLSGTDQEQVVDKYLKEALLPALHKNNISKVGVFKPLANDTAAVRKIYVLIPYKSLDQFSSITDKLDQDKQYQAAGADYLGAAYNNAPYQRIEKIVCKAFPGMPVMEPVKMSAPKTDRIYELRSYESATEKLHQVKVKMFNVGDEIALFKRLGFNAVFYSQALTGTDMPNLFYMTAFDNMTSHDQHWENFKSDPYWKKLSAMPEYANSVSKANIYLMRPTDYSDY